jgi:diamine N-acetyltransferase
MIELRKITWDNWEECLRLDVNDEQKNFVAQNEYSLAQSFLHITNDDTPPFSYAIYNEDVMVGYTLYFFSAADEDDADDKDCYYICRFMIDKRYQGKGYGRQAMLKILEHIKTFPHGKTDIVVLSYEPENTVAKKLYESLGFVETGKIDDGELVSILTL